MWVAACAGLIVFGTLMGAMFVGQQFLQNVLGYSPLKSGTAILPAAAAMVLIAPRSATLVESRGARFTLLTGYACCVAGFITMLILWAVGTAIAGSSQAGQITDRVQGELTKSFASAQAVANQYPQYANAMIAGAKSSFLSGADAAYTARIIAIVAGAVLVALLFPRRMRSSGCWPRITPRTPSLRRRSCRTEPVGGTVRAAPRLRISCRPDDAGRVQVESNGSIAVRR